MTKELDIFYAFLEDYADFMEGLSDQEDGKYAALLSFDAHKVDHVISEQQAALMRLDAMEKQREKLSLIHISEPTRQAEISYAVFCLKKKKKKRHKTEKKKNSMIKRRTTEASEAGRSHTSGVR